MGRLKIKICGLSRVEDIECVNKLQPDFIGFVFYPQSKRYVTVAQASELKQILSPKIKAVGVFVNSLPEDVAKIANADIIDYIQLHGDEDEVYITKLKALTKKPIIKAVRVKDEETLRSLDAYPVEYLLLDTYQKGVYGGTGQRMEIDLTKVHLEQPYFLAGGLDANNVAVATQNTQAVAVDVSGGVETDGVKDPAKIAAFIKAVRGDQHD